MNEQTNGKHIVWETRPIPPEVQAGIEEALRPRCPLCDTVLACGWYCPSCKSTVDDVLQLLRFKKAMEPTFGEVAFRLGLVLALFLFLLFVVGRQLVKGYGI